MHQAMVQIAMLDLGVIQKGGLERETVQEAEAEAGLNPSGVHMGHWRENQITLEADIEGGDGPVWWTQAQEVGD